MNEWVHKISKYRYWRSYIVNNNGNRVTKLFSIQKLGYDEAKRQAIVHRIQKEQELGYIGD